MYRYLFTIVDEVQRMRVGAHRPRLRAAQRAAGRRRIGRVATALFLRTYERAERVHLAMLARGFDQRMPRLDALAFRRADALFLAALAPAPRRPAWSHDPTSATCASPTPTASSASTASTCASRPGERVAMLGPNGAGKTTLMLHLNALLRGSGRAVRGGHERRQGAARPVGLVFQDPDDQLFMPTVREDVAFGPLNQRVADVEARVARALDAVRMREHADRAPHQLSLGQKRRVAIATVLAMDPSVLVLDEPSANLDPRTRRELIETLDAIDATMLIVTHDLPLAASLCERSGAAERGPRRRRRAHARPARRRAAPGRARPGAARRLRSQAAIAVRFVSIPSSSFCIGTLKASMPSRRS